MSSTWLRTFAASLAVVAGTAAAQDYPNRPIRIVVGFSPGGGGDSVARLMADHMSRTLKRPVLVENKPGAGTTLAPSFVAMAAPDGYTLLLAPDSVYGPDKVMYHPNVKYDESSFTMISKWAGTFFVMAANPKVGATNVAELKAKSPGNEIFVASTQGLYPAIIMENFSRLSGLKLNQVPYKGGAPSVVAAVGGEVPVTFAVPSSIMPMVKEGRLVALGITSPNRSRLTEGVPTLAEQGLKGFDVSYWFSLAGPAGLPTEVAQKLFDASSMALADPDVQAKLHALGYEPTPSKSMAEFRAEAIQTGERNRKLVESLGIKGN